MKKITLLIVITSFNISCRNKQQLNKINNAVEKINFEIKGLDAEDFEILERYDTIIYRKQMHEDIDGKMIEFDETKISTITAKVQFEFGFLQYTNDDSPPSSLPYSKETAWLDLTIRNGKIEIPDFYGNSKNVFISKLLGFNNNEMITDWILSADFENVKRTSIVEQTDFYKQILNKKENYQKCCPEYIEDAERFLQKTERDFKKFEDLHLELSCKSIEIAINGITSEGNSFRKVIISN